MAVDQGEPMGLPPEAIQPPAEKPKTDKFAWLKFWNKKTSATPVNGPIPGITPASPDQLLSTSGPKISLPEEQADQKAQIVQSSTKAA